MGIPNTKLRRPATLTALALACSPMSMLSTAQESRLEEIVVTGSRIVRTDYDKAGQIVSIGEVEIDAIAELNIADVLRKSPLNAYGSFSERSGSSASSNATFDLRGLGSERTLVMVDGKRLPGSPNLGADSVNINMLPMVAISRIDILADGASAVYGSDAVAGVVNLVTHRDVEGVELMARLGSRDRDDGGDKSIGILAGTSSDRGNVTFALEYSHRDPIFDRDREFTAPWIRDTNGDGEIHAYTDTDGISYFGRTWELFDETTGYYELKAAADCPTTNGFTGVMGAEALGDPDGTLCTYAYADVSANRAELEKVNSYINATYQISDSMEVYVQGLFSKVKSFGRFAPPAAGWPSPPEDHPHNPFDIDQLIADGDIDPNTYELYGYYRWTNIGFRDDHTDDNQYDMTVGITGDITEDASYEVYVQTGRYDSRSVGTYYLSYTGLDYVLTNGIDPFSEEGAGAMRATPTQDNFTKQRKVFGSVQVGTGDLFGAGETIALVGAEKVDTNYSNQYDAASEAGLIGGSSGNSSAGDRDFLSIFAEWLLPITDKSELSIAGRYDDYSDFGSAFSPTLSYSYFVTDSLSLRARWGEGFKAPSLADLYGPETFSAETGTDPVTDTTRQFDTYFNTNPDLDAESSESYSLGVNYEYAEGHTMDLAYYSVKIDDVIVTPTAQSMLFADAVGIAFDPNGSRVERTGGNVSAIYSVTSNAGQLEVNGLDFQLHSNFDTGIGLFTASAFISHQLEYKQNAYFQGGFQDTAGFFLQPQNRAQFTTSWSLDRHAIDLVIDYIGPHSEEDSVDEDTGVLTTSSSKLDAWTTANVAYRFDAGEFGKIKIGANNVTDEDPVLDMDDKYFDDFPDLYDNFGRVLFVEYRKEF